MCYLIYLGIWRSEIALHPGEMGNCMWFFGVSYLSQHGQKWRPWPAPYFPPGGSHGCLACGCAGWGSEPACVCVAACMVGLAVLVVAQPSPSLVLPNCLVYLQDESFKSFSEYALFLLSSENITEHMHWLGCLAASRPHLLDAKSCPLPVRITKNASRYGLMSSRWQNCHQPWNHHVMVS